MIILTAPDGGQTPINGADVVRIRDVYPEESPEKSARCHIDRPAVVFVTEATSNVVTRVKTENNNIGQLTLPTGGPVWFDAKKASGPLRLIRGQYPANARSSLSLAGKLQFVADAHDQVRAAILAAGGTPLPVPTDSLMATISDFVARITGSSPASDVWD
jgi:hypothetical protein